MKKKVLLSLLSVLAASSFLVSCGDENDPNSNPDSGNQDIVITDVLTGVKGYPDAVIDKEMKIVRVTINEDASTFNVNDIEASVNLDVKLYTEFDPTPIENPIITLKNGSNNYMVDFSYNGVMETWYLYIYKKPHYTDHLETKDINHKYTMGDLKPDGALIVYLNDEFTTVDISEATVTGFDTKTPGEKTMTISYKGLSIEFSYFVADPFEARLDYSNIYYVGDHLKLAIYYKENGIYKSKDFEKEDVKGIDFTAPGKQKGTIDFLNRSFEIEIEVKPYELEIELSNKKTEYYVTEESGIIPNGPLLIKENGRTRVIPIQETTITGFDLTTPGKKKVTISYEKYKYEYEINVIDYTYEFKIEDFTTEYNELDQYDYKGIIRVTRDDGVKFQINITPEMIIGFDTTKVGKQTITIKCDEYNFSQEVEINVKELDVKLDLSSFDKEYYIGDEFYYNKFVTYTINGEEFSDWLTKDMFGPLDLTKEGKQTVTIKFKNHVFSYELTIKKHNYSLDVKDIILEYFVGDKFRYTGSALINLDGTISENQLDALKITGFDSSKAGKITLTFTYEALNLTCQKEILIKEHQYRTNVEMFSEEIYYVGDEFNGNGHFQIYMDDSVIEEHKITKEMLEDFDTSKAGTFKVKVNLNGYSGEFEITVIEHEYRIDFVDYTKEYYVGDEFDGKGDFSFYTDYEYEKINITKDMLVGFDTSKAGVVDFKLVYRGIEAPMQINVKEHIVDVFVEDVTLYYYVGDEFDGKGLLNIRIDYKDNKIAFAKCEITGFDSSKEGSCKVNVKYKEYKASFDVNIISRYIYDEIDDHIVFRGFLDSKVTNAIIPSHILGKPVTEIAAGAFKYNKTITSITLPNTIIKLNDESFNDMENLEEVIISQDSKMEIIGESVFKGDKKLRSIVLPNSVNTIGMRAFEDCESLKEFTIPDNLVTITQSTFSRSGLVNIRFNETSKTKTIDVWAFSCCFNLAEDLYLPASLEKIDYSAFNNANIKNVILPANNQLKDISIDAFSQQIIVYSEDENVPANWDGYNPVMTNFALEKGTIDGLCWALAKDGSIYIVGTEDEKTFVNLPKQINNKPVSQVINYGLKNINIEGVFIPEGIKINLDKQNINKNGVYYTDANNYNSGIEFVDHQFDYPLALNCTSEIGITPEGLKWVASKDNEIIITGANDVEKVTIPNTINGKQVTEIAHNAFSHGASYEALKEIYLPFAIKMIREKAFNLSNYTIYTSEKELNPLWEQKFFFSIVWNYGNLTGITSEGLKWALTNDNEITIYGSTMEFEELTIPNLIENKPVTIIDVNYNKPIIARNIFIPENSNLRYVDSNSFINDAIIYTKSASLSNELEESPLRFYSIVYNYGGKYGVTTTGLKWALNNKNEAIITGAKDNVTYVDIPVTISGYKVVSINSKAFENNKNITKLNIVYNSPLILIMQDAFAECSNLTTAYIPSTVKTIEYFSISESKLVIYTDALAKPEGWDYFVPIKNKVIYNYGGKEGTTTDGISWVLRKDKTLEIINVKTEETFIQIPEKIEGYLVASLGSGCLNEANNLTKIEVLGAISSIEDGALSNLKNLEALILADASKLTNVGIALPQNNKLIIYIKNKSKPENFNFWLNYTPVVYNYGGEYGITEAGIKWALTSEDKMVITGITENVVDLVIPEMINNKPVTEISESAFNGKSSIKTVLLPKSIEKIDISSFNFCMGIEKIFYSGSEEDYSKVLWESTQFTSKIYYYSLVALDGVNAWHYDTDNKTPIVW